LIISIKGNFFLFFFFFFFFLFDLSGVAALTQKFALQGHFWGDLVQLKINGWLDVAVTQSLQGHPVVPSYATV